MNTIKMTTQQFNKYITKKVNKILTESENQKFVPYYITAGDSKYYEYPETGGSYYYNKKINKFVTPSEVRNFDKNDFLCNIDDVKVARLAQNEIGSINPKSVKWQHFRYFEDRFFRDPKDDAQTNLSDEEREERRNFINTPKP